MPKANLIPPYGGKLVNLVLTGKQREELKRKMAKEASLLTDLTAMMKDCL